MQRDSVPFWGMPINAPSGHGFVQFFFSDIKSFPSKWAAVLNIYVRDLHQMLSRGFVIVGDNILDPRPDITTGVLNNSGNPTPWDNCGTFDLLGVLDDDSRWEGELRVYSPEKEVLRRTRVLRILRPELVYLVKAKIERDGKKELVYRYNSRDPGRNLNILVPEKPMQAWWPWAGEQDEDEDHELDFQDSLDP